ncbi:MAG: SpoIID/LytB domain-containing protein [Thermoanaerobaculaceae bacterium]
MRLPTGRGLAVAFLLLQVAPKVLLSNPPPGEISLKVSLGVVPAPQFPELGRRFLVSSGENRQLLRGPLTVLAEPPELVAQVGVFSQPAGAAAFALRLQALGLTVTQVEEAGRTRVLVVPPPGSAMAEFAELLKSNGYDVFWVVGKAGVVRVKGGEGGEVSGESVAVLPVEELPVQVGKSRFRGEFLCLAGSGGPEVINLVPLETYLLGVVPAEMGFAQMEALKAQAVVARTYALANLGRHRQSGYDLCSKEHCQVYGGADAEEPLASKAVEATRGLVLTFAGRPAEVYFHSTCGGHTEAAEGVLTSTPLPYLGGVACRGEVVHLGEGPPGPHLSPQEGLELVARRLAQAVGADTPLAFAQALGQSSEKTLEKALRLPDFSPLFPGGESLDRILFRFQPTVAFPQGTWVWALRLGQLAGKVEAREGCVVPGEKKTRWRPSGEGEERILDGIWTLWQEGNSYRKGGGETVAGSRATLWCVGEQCPVVTVEVADAADERSRFRAWIRELSAEELASRVGVSGVREVRIVSRTRTGRVARVEIHGDGGSRELTGPEFRGLLGLPSTWFVLARRQSPGLMFRFFGKGWGHGVGLCQNGAHGLALGGWDFARILAHYFPGTKLEPYYLSPGGT